MTGDRAPVVAATIRTTVAAGDLADAVAAAARALPRHLAAALRLRGYRRAGIGGALAVFVLYLFAIGDIAVAAGRDGRPIELAADWSTRIFAARAPYLYEPVLAISPLPGLTVFVSPGNILFGGLLACLFGMNIMLTAVAVFAARSCRPTTFGRLLGGMPAFLAGFACCTPTFVVLLGSGVAAVLVPVFVPLRVYLVPLSLALLATVLLWNAHSLSRVQRG